MKELEALPCVTSDMGGDCSGPTACATCGLPADARAELDLLREVHEAARQYLRFRGIDKERQDAALVRLEDATEAVKDYEASAS
jgi:hypothetical protein